MRFVSLLVLFMILLGCNSTYKASDTVMFTQGVGLELSAAQSSLYSSHWQKRMFVMRQGQERALLSQLEIDATGAVKLGLMTSVGLPVLTLNYSQKHGLRAKEYVSLQGLDAQYILADIQLVHWPITQVQEYVRGAHVTQSDNGNVRVRELYTDERLLIRITYDAHRITLSNFIHEYEIRFEEVL
ncbi:DUF3261 domain-containing protein [Pseudoalteromonas sp. SSDWG2]|uniref:DUF3261 domain-containing protein n=1 Tax=Pseudoalteromonas sp. SSDWG2 TaxID=3139391 RepID=UPI003BAD63C7